MKKNVTFFEFSEMNIAERAVFTSANGELIYRKKFGKVQKDIFRLNHFYVFAEYTEDHLIEVEAFLSIEDSLNSRIRIKKQESSETLF